MSARKCRVAAQVDLGRRGKPAQPESRFLRPEEGRLGEVHLGGDCLHPLLIAWRVEHTDGRGVAAKRLMGKRVNLSYPGHDLVPLRVNCWSDLNKEHPGPGCSFQCIRSSGALARVLVRAVRRLYMRVVLLRLRMCQPGGVVMYSHRSRRLPDCWRCWTAHIRRGGLLRGRDR